MAIKNYWQQYIVWIGLVIALVPLLIIMKLQYRSLCELEQTSTVSYRMAAKTYLKSVVAELEQDYRLQAEQLLNSLAKEVTQQQYSDIKTSEIKLWDGAKQIFFVSFNEQGDSSTYFYNPTTKLLELRFDSKEKRAVNAACTLWGLSKRSTLQSSNLSSQLLTVNELDPENRLILKPIFDNGNNTVGIVGLIINSENFKKRLAQAIKESLPMVFPEDNKKMVITVRDGSKNLIMSSCSKNLLPRQNDEVEVTLPFIFTDWILGYQNYDITLEELAHSNFRINLTLSILMAIVLLSGIAITLHTIAKEKKLSQMKTDFVSNVSHELRTPLSSIRVFGEFMRLGWVKDSAKVREYGEYIEAESRRLTQLIDNILDFSRISSGHKTYQMEPTDITNLIQTTLKVFEVQQKQQGFNITLETPDKKIPLLQIDENALVQALINLVDNAIKYSNEDKNISVKLTLEKEYVSISISDRGVGIAKDEQAKIFEKFYRVNTRCSHIHDIKGSGLGLSIVKHVVDAHCGKVTLESTLGKGSSFTIYLPLKNSVVFTNEEAYEKSSYC
ncbi:MAG: GHKL domain-containing protein [Acidobacteria bacterium]|nr:GHKL domain-containing protein [Acidobacteriota bacterium]